MMKKIILFTLLIFCTVFYESFGQDVDAETITFKNETANYAWTKFISGETVVGGIMHTKTSNNYGNGNDLVLYAGNRDINLRPGTGNISFFPKNNFRAFLFTANGTYTAYNGSTAKGIRMAHGGSHAYLTNLGTVGDLKIRWRNSDRISILDGSITMHKVTDFANGLRVGNSWFHTGQGGSLELGGRNDVAGTGIPFIDFHYGTAGNTSVEDYNVRLINKADGVLYMEAPNSNNTTLLVKTPGTNKKAIVAVQNGANRSLNMGIRESDGAGILWHQHNGWKRFDLSFTDDYTKVTVGENAEGTKKRFFAISTQEPLNNGRPIERIAIANDQDEMISFKRAGVSTDYGYIFKSGQDGNFVLARRKHSGVSGGDEVIWEAAAGGENLMKVRGTLEISHASGGPDYVFEDEYQENMRSIKELEEYINIHKHLPGVKSAKEFEEQGFDVVRDNFSLLEKIEELYLYTIELEKKIERLNSRINKDSLED